jgi:hypothetical protein
MEICSLAAKSERRWKMCASTSIKKGGGGVGVDAPHTACWLLSVTLVTFLCGEFGNDHVMFDALVVGN